MPLRKTRPFFDQASAIAGMLFCSSSIVWLMTPTSSEPKGV